MPRWIPQRSRSSFIFRPGFAHLQDEMTKGLSLPMKMGREIASFHAELRGGANKRGTASRRQLVGSGRQHRGVPRLVPGFQGFQTEEE